MKTWSEICALFLHCFPTNYTNISIKFTASAIFFFNRVSSLNHLSTQRDEKPCCIHLCLMKSEKSRSWMWYTQVDVSNFSDRNWWAGINRGGSVGIIRLCNVLENLLHLLPATFSVKKRKTFKRISLASDMCLARDEFTLFPLFIALCSTSE